MKEHLGPRREIPVVSYLRYTYPFTAIIGQEKMKLALVLNAINPLAGGVLVRGEKGTAKSTAVRALAALLPEIEVVAGCPCNCDPRDEEWLCPFCQERLAAGNKLKAVTRRVPLVELPVSATEDRVVGSLDFEQAIRHGERRLAPGLLAQASRGIIYVDEINLLDDHLVDILLDAAASGTNVVEREGIKFTHPARFILVGTMNPEEGELRPQLLDRFGLCVPVEGVDDPATRAAITRQREAFDKDPLGFRAGFAAQEEDMRRRLQRARDLLPQVGTPTEVLRLAVDQAMEALVAGHRAEITLVQAARALAAWEGRRGVTTADLERVAELVLCHRRRQPPPPAQQQREKEESKAGDPPELPEDQEPQGDQVDDEVTGRQQPAPEISPEAGQQEHEHRESQEEQSPAGVAGEALFTVGEPFPVRRIEHHRDRVWRKGSGRRSRTRTPVKVGRYVRATLRRERHDLAFDATLRAAAPYQGRRARDGLAVVIEPPDIREKVREKRVGNLLLFLVDASGSMAAQQRMVAAKGAVLSLLLDAYQKRDRVGMVAFRGEQAEILLPPTSSVELAQKCLAELPTGGRTPLAAGLLKAYEVTRAHLLKDPDLTPLVIVVSDGRGNVGLGQGKPWDEVRQVADLIRREERIKVLVVDVEKDGFLAFGLARELAGVLEAGHYQIEALKADTLVRAVRDMQDGGWL
ncbi:MAG: putative cobaltochelatase [Clostridia bacterium]|nr:MAG: putative cobaltochelatase [Clostridia bacterium]